jgi:predicted short-subunit dehydrogenase-like oxidoreductase (DUF2520 family)
VSDRLFIIGAGKVGRGLASAFRNAGVSVLGVHARTPRDGATSSGELPSVVGEASVVIIAVTDAAIDDVCLELAAHVRSGRAALAHGAVVLHTSGTASPAGLDALRTLGFPCGTFHPLVPFASAERGASLLRDGWVGIDGDATACATSRRLAAALGARTVNIPVGAKPAYHVAAVIASNFPVVLAALAARLLARNGVEERTAEQVVNALMRAAVANLEHGSAAAVLTGPAARNDLETLAQHREVVRTDPELSDVYDALTRAALRLAGHAPVGGIDDAHVGRRREAK